MLPKVKTFVTVAGTIFDIWSSVFWLKRIYRLHFLI